MDEIITEYVNDRGETVAVHLKPDGLYNTYVDGQERQHSLSAESVIRWMAHISHREKTDQK